MAISHSALEKLNINHMIAISQAVSQAKEWKPALDNIVQLVRTIFIFDNLVLYLYDEKEDNLESAYAKAVGRGQKAGADLAWGESIANRIQKNRKTLVEEAIPDPQINRLQQPYILAVPLLLRSQFLGALMYIRFGGPAFTPENIKLGEYIAWHISLLVQRQKIQEANVLLEMRNKLLQFQDDFVSTITHELRTPLGFIKGYSTTLLRNDAQWDAGTQREFLQIIDSEADHLQQLIESVLDSSRLQSGQIQMFFQPISIDRFLEDIITRAQTHFPNISIKLHKKKGNYSLQADPNRLAQVFENIFANASKYAPDKELKVTLQVLPEDQVEIKIQDQGPGIPAEDLPHIFERFYRAASSKTAIRGTGLGLYICLQIVEAHHGQIRAESQPGEGTAFIIALPCRQPED